MKNKPALGLGSAVSDEVDILHSSILGRTCFGRLADLVVTWVERKSDLDQKKSGNIRILIQALLEFAYPKNGSAQGYFEFSTEKNLVFVSVRFPNQQFSDDFVDLENELAQFWMTSDETLLLKKILFPSDRIEVRAHHRLNLVEWRICRSIDSNVSAVEEVNFEVFIDREEGIQSKHNRYTDLGDLPFSELLKDIYQSSKQSHSAGEFFYQGSSIQAEDEQVRVLFEQEQMKVDAEVIDEMTVKEDQPEALAETLRNREFQHSLTKIELARIEKDAKKMIDEMGSVLEQEKNVLRNSVEDVVKEFKIKEFQLQKNMISADLKMRKLEALLKKKELDCIKKGNSIKVLNDRIEELKDVQPEKQGGFKEKALQMYTQLREVKKENEILETMLIELKKKEVAGDGKTSRTNDSAIQLDELTKKLERTTRALEAEKLKVKGLFERVMVAEKEAQTAGPMLDELERKAEVSSRTAQQHKKELENLKQKLIKSDAEKNKIQNDLVKTQAQVQTLMKRQAS